MTKEELKLEALKYLENFKDCANCKHRWGDCADELDEDCLINNCYSATPKEQDIYLAGAEPREKRIEELEETINKLREQFALRYDLEDKIKDLEKENTELKETLKTYNGCGDWDNDFHTCRVYLQLEELQKYAENLTKAKEIILRLYNAGRDVLMCRAEEKAYDNLSDAINDKSIEQFLKDSEVEK